MLCTYPEDYDPVFSNIVIVIKMIVGSSSHSYIETECYLLCGKNKGIVLIEK